MLMEEQRRSWEGRKGWRERTGRQSWKYCEGKVWRWECQANSKSSTAERSRKPFPTVDLENLKSK